MPDTGVRSSPAEPPRVWRSTLIAALILPMCSSGAFAHAVVHPTRSVPRAYERYELRVPNERDVPTTRVQIAFPEEVRVISFAEVVGWELEVLSDESGRITGAVWTVELAVGRFVEFPFVAVNPDGEARLAWRTDQTYADGDVVAWSGPEESATPASFTTIARQDGETWPTAVLLSAAALVISILALGLAFRWRRH